MLPDPPPRRAPRFREERVDDDEVRLPACAAITRRVESVPAGRRGTPIPGETPFDAGGPGNDEGSAER